MTGSWRSETIEKEFEFVQKAAKLIRSARSDYTLPNKTKTEAYIVASDDSSKAVLDKFSFDLATLSYCSKIDIVNPPPTGCAILTLTGTCEIHLLLKGLIDPEKEIVKLQKKKEFLDKTVESLNKQMLAADYSTKVPTEVQEANKEKLEQSESEIKRIIEAMGTLKLM